MRRISLSILLSATVMSLAGCGFTRDITGLERGYSNGVTIASYVDSEAVQGPSNTLVWDGSGGVYANSNGTVKLDLSSPGSATLTVREIGSALSSNVGLTQPIGRSTLAVCRINPNVASLVKTKDGNVYWSVYWEESVDIRQIPEGGRVGLQFLIPYQAKGDSISVMYLVGGAPEISTPDKAYPVQPFGERNSIRALLGHKKRPSAMSEGYATLNRK